MNSTGPHLLPFLLVVGALLSAAGVASVVRGRLLHRAHEQADAWPKVPGVLVRSELVTEASGEEVLHRVEISCEYTVRGQRLVTSRHTHGVALDEPDTARRALAEHYPCGKTVSVSVDPSNPDRAILITGIPVQATPLLNVGRLLLGIGLGCLFIGLLVALNR